MATLMSPNDALLAYRLRTTQSIHAIQWTGENLREVQAFMYPQSPLTQSPTLLGLTQPGGGLRWIEVGDWILQIGGSFQIMSDEQFQTTYEVSA